MCGGQWVTFDIHMLALNDDDALVLRHGEEQDDKSVRLTVIAAFPPGGWQGFRITRGQGIEQAVGTQIGFKPTTPDT
jgi:hypothetical protein